MTVITQGFALLLLSQLALTAPSQNSENRATKAPYCICYDAQDLAETGANQITKYICNNVIPQGRYVNGFGPDPPGKGGITGACVSPNLYAHYADEFEKMCKTYGGLKYSGGCFSEDGNEHCIGGETIPDCPS